MQVKICKDTKCGREDTREVMRCDYIPPSAEECDGCLLENICRPFGFRVEDRYCDISKNIYPQKNIGEICDNDFECSTNICHEGICKDLERILEEGSGIIRILGCKITHPFNNDAYLSCLE